MAGRKGSHLLSEPDLRGFWTAYDPLDQSTDSIDPLGFLASYVALADRILPGFTTITTVPRYLSLLCQAIPSREQRDGDVVDGEARRQEVMARMQTVERAWALACGLAAPMCGDAATDGLRGIRAVRRQCSLHEHRKTIPLNYALLSNQMRYGGIGAYSVMLDALHLANMTTLVLRPLGEELAAAFPQPTGFNLESLSDEQSLSVEDLRAWGCSAHCGAFTAGEAAVLRKALQGGEEETADDKARWTMLALLRDCSRDDAVHESELLRACLIHLRGMGSAVLPAASPVTQRLDTALDIIEPYEQLYQGSSYVFDHVRDAAEVDLTISLSRVAARKAVASALKSMRKAAAGLIERLGSASDEPSSLGPAGKPIAASRLLAYAAEIVATTDDAKLIAVLVRRHQQVQSDKDERGATKMPWVVIDDSTAPNARLSDDYFRPKERLPDKWDQAPRHPYRTHGARQFIRMSRMR